MAVTTETGIVNVALLHLGHAEILSFEDATKPGQLARATYELHRDALLRGFTWNFAIKRTTLTSSVLPDDVWGYEYAYNKPPDCLRVVQVNYDRDIPWAVEGQQIVTNIEPPMELRYIQRRTDVGNYDPFFIQALAARLAAFWAEPLGKASTLQETMVKLFAQVMAEAVSCDSVEKTPEVIDASSWLLSRIGSTTRYAKLEGDPQPL